MALKCLHKGCGKSFTEVDEPCTYHPGPPLFHEGQKGWKCCKPRVLTFDEFLTIPPCTTGLHSTTVEVPTPVISAQDPREQKPPSTPTTLPLPPKPVPIPNTPSTAAIPPLDPISSPNPTPLEPDDPSDSDSAEESKPPIAPDTPCSRRSCSAIFTASAPRSAPDQCRYHPGAPLFHEGSKGWTCCRRRVLEFDEFMKIPGCRTRDRHRFARSGTAAVEAEPATGGVEGTPTKSPRGGVDEELLDEGAVRSDFYQTASQVHVSFFLKKIDPASAVVKFHPQKLELDLVTADRPRPKRWRSTVELYGAVEPEECAFRVLGTKLEVTLQKAGSEGARGWSVLRRGEGGNGGIYQVGGPGRM